MSWQHFCLWNFTNWFFLTVWSDWPLLGPSAYFSCSWLALCQNTSKCLLRSILRNPVYLVLFYFFFTGNRCWTFLINCTFVIMQQLVAVFRSVVLLIGSSSDPDRPPILWWHGRHLVGSQGSLLLLHRRNRLVSICVARRLGQSTDIRPHGIVIYLFIETFKRITSFFQIAPGACALVMAGNIVMFLTIYGFFLAFDNEDGFEYSTW